MKRPSTLKQYTQTYLKHRPLFLSLIRGKELQLYHQQLENKNSLGKILDFGSGDGFFLGTLLESLPNLKVDVTGLEIESIDPQLLQQSQHHGVYRNMITYDGHKIPFADATFDTVVSNCVLEHVTHLDQGISELARALKSGGKLYTTVMTGNWEKYLFGAVFAKDAYQSWMRRQQVHPNLLSHEEWNTLFNATGFKVVTATGYLNKYASRWIDLLHYVSLPSLISYRLTRRWVLWSRLFDVLPVDRWIAGLTGGDIDPQESAALFYVLEKA